MPIFTRKLKYSNAKFYTMRKLYFLFLLGISYCSIAQKTIDVNATNANGISTSSFYAVNGTPFVNSKFVNLIEGTPYLTTYWLKGRVIGSNGQRYSATLLKIDLLSSELHFMNKAGVELVTNLSTREMFLEDTVKNYSYHLFNASFLPVDKNEKSQWYQLLDSGKTKLYKVYMKLLSETLPYGAFTHEQRITTKEKYYVEVNNALVNVKDIKDLPAVLPGKKEELTSYLKKQDDKSLSIEDRWKKIIRFYNSLSL